MAITQIRNEQIKDLTIELGKIREGAELIKRDGTVAYTGDVNLNSHYINNLNDPVQPQDAATKAYVDATAQGLFVKDAVRVIARTDISIDPTMIAPVVDGVTLTWGDRLLLAGQTNAADNGIYTLLDAEGGYVFARSTDADTSAKVKSGLFTFVTEGSVNDNSGWVLTTDNPITLGTTALAFSQFSGAGQLTAGAGLTKSGNTLDLVSAGSDRIVVNSDNIDLANAGTAGQYNVTTTDQYGRVVSGVLRTLTSATNGLTIVDGDGVNGNPTLSLAGDVVALANVTGNGLVTRSATGTIVTRTIQGTDQQVTVVNGDGVSGNPVVSLTDFGTAGSYNVVVTDSKGRVESAFLRTLTSANTSALTITNGDGLTANPTITLDNDLIALANVSTTGFGVRTATDAWATRAIEGTLGTIVVANGDAVASNPTITLAEVADSGNGAFLKFTRDGFGRVNGTTAVTLADITALAADEYVNVAGDTLTGFLTLHSDPEQAMHAVTKQYVDAVATGLDLKASVRAASISNFDLTTDPTTLAAAAIFDGVQLNVNDRVLLKDQTVASENGVYVLLGGEGGNILVRAQDADGTPGNEVTSGMFTFVEEGSYNGNNGWALTTNEPIVLGTTDLEFTQFTGAGQVIAGAGLTKNGNQLDIISASADRIVVNLDSIDLATTGVAAGNYNNISVDIYGRVNAAELRTLTSSDLGAITITNGDGLAGNPTIHVDADLVALAGISSTGFAVRTAADTWTTRSVVSNAAALTVTNGDAVDGNITLDLAGNLSKIADLTGTGITTRLADGSFVSRTIESANTLLSVTNGNAVSANPSLDLELNTGWVIRGDANNKAKAYMQVFNEAITTVDNVTYTPYWSLQSGTEQVYVNGLLQRAGSTYDYTVVDGNIVFNSALMSADGVLITYYALPS